MNSNLDLQLANAEPHKVNIFSPYFKNPKQRIVLPRAISLYERSSLIGTRFIEHGTNIPFEAEWNVGLLPADTVTCSVTFEEYPGNSYRLSIDAANFIKYLIEFIMSTESEKKNDFPIGFYKDLMKIPK
jgi:hypothetical protein